MIDTNDPRLTAYALGELEAAEAAAFEAALATEAGALAEVNDIRRAAAELRLALADESVPALTEGQREAIRSSAARGVTGSLSGRLRLLPWAVAAAAACLAVALFVRPYVGSREQPLSLAQQAPAPSSAAWFYSDVEQPAAAQDVSAGAKLTATGALPAAPPPAGLEEAKTPATLAPALLIATAPAPAAAAAAASEPRTFALAAAKDSDDDANSRVTEAVERAAPRALREEQLAESLAAAPTAAPMAARGVGHAAPGQPAAAAAGTAGGAFGTALAMQGDEARDARRQAGGIALGVAPSIRADEPRPDNPFRSVTGAPLSIVPLNVDTASYSNVRNFLTQGQLPPSSAVHIEGLVNHFSYGNENAAAGLPFSVRAEVTACPWKPDQRLVRIAVNRAQQPDAKQEVTHLAVVTLADQMQATATPLERAGVLGDVQLQVAFSPARVAVYRLIGNDASESRSQDALGKTGAIGPGQSVNAFYQIIPTPAATPPASAFAATPAAARAKSRARPAAPAADALAVITAGNLLTVTLRWRPVDAGDAGRLEVPVPDQPQAWEQTSSDMQFGSAVALFGMLLRQSPHAAGATFDTVLALAGPAAGQDTPRERSEFLELVRQAKQSQQAAAPR